MMVKTAKEIQGDILALLRGSALAEEVSGNIYRSGYRPLNSQAEDITVGFVTGVSREISEGVVVVNVYVADIDYGNGTFVENGERTAEIEHFAAQWVKSLTAERSDYLFELAQTIATEAESEVRQHFVTIRLNYRLFTS